MRTVSQILSDPGFWFIFHPVFEIDEPQWHQLKICNIFLQADQLTEEQIAGNLLVLITTVMK